MTPAAVDTDTREEILAAAADLFTTAGFAATGTREIAGRAGLRQASLFHYFAHKDDLLAELLDRTVAPALTAAAWLDTAGAEPEVRLYALTRQDARNLCSGPPNLGVLQLMPEAKRERFGDFWAKRAQLRSRYLALAEEAAKAGKLVDLPAETLTDLVFGAVEATMTWYRGDHDLDPDVVAEAVASAAVRGIMSRPPAPERLRRAGDRLLATRPM
ncbi:MAG TPA: helix-turn-helix domain-containing protein [Acidimicrobiales bacterium]